MIVHCYPSNIYIPQKRVIGELKNRSDSRATAVSGYVELVIGYVECLIVQFFICCSFDPNIRGRRLTCSRSLIRVADRERFSL